MTLSPPGDTPHLTLSPARAMQSWAPSPG